MEDFVVLYHDYDLLVIPLTFIFFYALGRTISRKVEPDLRGYFIWGMVFKMIATIIFGLVIQFYFKGGDTNRYYIALLDLKKAVSDDPGNLFHIYGRIKMTYDNPVAPYIANDKLGDNLLYMVKTSNYMVPRFGLIFSYLFGNSYTALSMCYSFFAFWGCWKCFNVFAAMFPHLKKAMAVTFLFFPSVVYWGSAIMKDSICLGSLGLFVFSFHAIFFAKKRVVLNVFSLFFWGMILFFTKPYLLLAMIPGLSLWYFLQVNKKIKDKSLRYASFAILLVVISASVIFIIQFMLSLEFLEMEKYKGENLIQFAASAQELYKEAGGSVFDIGQLDGTFGSFATMFPKAVNASLFRPYLWEVKSPAMLISAVESVMILYMIIFAFVKLKTRFFKIIFKNPVMVFMMVYSVFLAGLVAITTNNFGSLVRYKIAAMPFFVGMLFLVLSQVPNIKRHPFIGRLMYTRKQRVLNT